MNPCLLIKSTTFLFLNPSNTNLLPIILNREQYIRRRWGKGVTSIPHQTRQISFQHPYAVCLTTAVTASRIMIF